MARASNPLTLNDGVVRICMTRNAADAGAMPVEKLCVKHALRYAERTVGLGRFWTAMQNNVRVDKVIRCYRIDDVSTQDVAIMPDGCRYKISQIQYPEDNAPRVMDLTLEKVVHNYDRSTARN